MPSVRLASFIAIAGTTAVCFFAAREYRSLVDYCKGSPEVAAGGDSLSCLEPQHWFAEAVLSGAFLLLVVAVWVVLGAAIARRRERATP